MRASATFPLPHYLHNLAWIRPDSTSSFVLANLSFVNLLESAQILQTKVISVFLSGFSIL